MIKALTGEIPLTSRDAEIDRILAGLDGLDPAAFVLAGAAGVGKTRLASEAARLATSRGFDTAKVVASRAAATIPFGPFAPFLPETGSSPGDLLGLLRQASDAVLRRAGRNRRLLLVVDDAQLLDDGSAALVHQLVHERACSVLASLRTPDPAPDPVTALWKDGLAERIDLSAWTESETEAVLSAFLGGPVAGGTVRRLWQLSAGNALYLRELLIGAVDTGVLSQSGGIWSLHRPLTAPGRLVELVASRMAGLDPGTVAVIEMLAIGEPLGIPLLESMTSPAALEDAEEQGFAYVVQDGRRAEARLAHPIYGEALRQSLPRSRLRRISATLADSIEAAGARRRDDLLRLGRWRLDSGAPGDPALLTRAALRAGKMFDNELAARLAQAAMDMGGGVDAGIVLGETRFHSGRHAEAEAVLAGLVPMCQTDDERARVASARAHNFHNLLGDPAAAYAVLDDALAVVTEPGPRMRLLGRLATLKVFEPDPEGVLIAARPMLDSGDDALIARGSYVSSIALALLGRSEEAVATAYSGLESHRRASDFHHGPEVQLIGAIFGHAAGGRFARALSDAATAYQSSMNAGDKEGEATYLLLSGLVMIDQGQLAKACKAFMDGASVNREISDPAALRWCLAGQALAEAMSGHAGKAAAAAAERDQLSAGPMGVYEMDLVDRSAAWVSVAGGELSRAREILTAAAARAAGHRLRIAEARLLHDVARLGQPELAAPRLAELAELADGQFVPALASHADALARADAADLEAAGLAFATLGAALLAAEAYAAAATGYRSDGLLRKAAAAERRAAELAALCGDVRTPGISQGGASERLTRREREVAGMAAAGASSKEIAAKLVLSVRTVENHLQSAYLKLGVTSREELAAVLGS